MIQKKPLIVTGVLVLLVIAVTVTYVVLTTRANKKDEDEEVEKAIKEKENKAKEELMCRRAVDMYIPPIGTECLKEHDFEKFGVDNENRSLCIVYSNKPEQPSVSKLRTAKPDRVTIIRALKENEELFGKYKTYNKTLSSGKCRKEESTGGSISEGTVQVKLTPSATVYDIAEFISDELCITTSTEFQGYRNIKLTRQPNIPVSKYNDDTCNQQFDSEGWKLIGYLESRKDYTVDLKTDHFTKLISTNSTYEAPTIVCGQPSKCGTS